VAIAEPICFYAALRISLWLNIKGLAAFVAYGVLALFPNLLLIPSEKQNSGIWAPRRFFWAFVLGLIYLLCLFPVGLCLSGLVDTVLTSSGRMR
jgi:hypothetical protein